MSVAKPNQIITMINQERASHVYRQDPMRTQNSRKRLKRRKTRMPLSWGIIVLVFDWLRRWHAFSSVVRRPYVKAAQSRGFTFTQLKVAVSLFSKISLDRFLKHFFSTRGPPSQFPSESSCFFSIRTQGFFYTPLVFSGIAI